MTKPGILLKAKFDLSEIDFVPEQSNRKVDPALEEEAKRLWLQILEESKAKGILAYENENNYRLNSFDIVNKRLVIHAGIIKFSIKDTIRRIPRMHELSHEYWGKGLSITGFLETSDNYFVVGVRSGKTLSSGKSDLIGGSLDVLYSGKTYLKDMYFKELREELSIDPLSSVETIKFLGIVISTTGYVPLICQTKLYSTKDEVYETFKNANDKEEMKDLMFLTKSELKKWCDETEGYKPSAFLLLD